MFGYKPVHSGLYNVAPFAVVVVAEIAEADEQLVPKGYSLAILVTPHGLVGPPS